MRKDDHQSHSYSEHTVDMVFHIEDNKDKYRESYAGENRTEGNESRKIKNE